MRFVVQLKQIIGLRSSVEPDVGFGVKKTCTIAQVKLLR